MFNSENFLNPSIGFEKMFKNRMAGIYCKINIKCNWIKRVK